MSYLDDQTQGIVMWALVHVASGSWHHGHAPLTLYPSAHDALYSQDPEVRRHGGFQPVPVLIRDAKERER